VIGYVLGLVLGLLGVLAAIVSWFSTEDLADTTGAVLAGLAGGLIVGGITAALLEANL